MGNIQPFFSYENGHYTFDLDALIPLCFMDCLDFLGVNFTVPVGCICCME